VAVRLSRSWLTNTLVYTNASSALRRGKIAVLIAADITVCSPGVGRIGQPQLINCFPWVRHVAILRLFLALGRDYARRRQVSYNRSLAALCAI
jgi:hypothetical protein